VFSSRAAKTLPKDGIVRKNLVFLISRIGTGKILLQFSTSTVVKAVSGEMPPVTADPANYSCCIVDLFGTVVSSVTNLTA